jgi:hypothetical protein
MKFPVNVEKIVLLGLLFFYVFIIVFHFWVKSREGMETPEGNSKTLDTSTTTSTPSPTSPTTATTTGATESAPKSTGTNQDRIDELNKKIEDLKSKIHNHEKEISDIKKLSEITTP